ncbi:MAG: tetrahydromethanopterin S-methyltransferase subunit A [Chloroflexota bacterium]|nr:tetrahydromethanopterin S-methyltransferase subunit A [Chloroflexota bacterium]
MLKVKTPEGYPPEEGRYARGNDYSPVAVCVILDDFDYRIPADLQELVMAGIDSGAALSGMLQTENVGTEKLICNIIANPNIRYIVLCGRESPGHMPGQSLLCLKQNGVDESMNIIGSTGPTPYLSNLPVDVVSRFREQIVIIVDMLCPPGEKNTESPGLNPKMVEQAVWSCYQEEPTEFMGYTLYDMGAYPHPPILHRIVSKLEAAHPEAQPGKFAMGMGLKLKKLLPNTNCKECGRRNCLAFAIDLAKGKSSVDECPILFQHEYAGGREALKKLLE